MGYWSNQPMVGDYPEDIQGDFRDRLLNLLNKELLDKFNNNIQDFEVGKIYNMSEINIDKYEENINEFINWLQNQCNTNEENILNEIASIYIESATENGFHGADKNQIAFILPLSFLDWDIKLNPKLSKFLLRVLKCTDGCSEDRGYPIEENAYPNGINTPSDFIRTYIDKWDDLISGKINMKDIESTSTIKSIKFGRLINTR